MQAIVYHVAASNIDNELLNCCFASHNALLIAAILTKD
jgi:hypothetical protein